MIYAIRHFNRYRYSEPVSQSTMEVRMHPRNEYSQRCFTFQLSVNPRVQIFSYSDHVGNVIHHFDMPEPHKELTIIADALVDVDTPPELPEKLDGDAWRELDDLISQDDYWDMLMPSHFARSSPELKELAVELEVDRRDDRDPLTLLRQLNERLYNGFSYVRNSTSVDSPIEEALQARQGVCQDFAHIMIALARNLRIPSRYVSGYLHRDAEHKDRSSDEATHAWVEVMLPRLGWVGFDPTNNLIAGGRHIRTAIGRDYADVPPTKGTMVGSAATDLKVHVRVSPSDAVLTIEQDFAADEEWTRLLEKSEEPKKAQTVQQQQ